MSTNKTKYNQSLLQIVESKKSEWASNLKDISILIRSKDPHDMADAQALVLSYRTMILEEISYFLNELSSENEVFKQMKRDRFILYTTGMILDQQGNYVRPTGNLANHPIIGNSKISGGQKDMIISGDYSEYERCIEILEQSVDFLRECVKTIDQYMYSIKNRLELFSMFK